MGLCPKQSPDFLPMRLSAGKFDQFVLILEQSEQRGATGALERSEPEEVCRRWANAVPEASTRFQQLNAVWVSMKAAYTLNGPTPVVVGQWLEHQGRRLQIIGIETPGNVPPTECEQPTVICEGKDA